MRAGSPEVRRVGRALATCAVLVIALSSPVQGGRTTSITLSPARRGESREVVPLPPHPGCARLAVIGDSLTLFSQQMLADVLSDAGHRAVIDAAGNRRIPRAAGEPLSGVLAAERVRRQHGEFDCWVIALGTNDLPWVHDVPNELGSSGPAVAGRVIDEMLAAVTPGAAVWWIDVNHRGYRTATRTFNGVLAERDASSHLLTVIDWYTPSQLHPSWFMDSRHLTLAGNIARTAITVWALPAPLPR